MYGKIGNETMIEEKIVENTKGRRIKYETLDCRAYSEWNNKYFQMCEYNISGMTVNLLKMLPLEKYIS